MPTEAMAQMIISITGEIFDQSHHIDGDTIKIENDVAIPIKNDCDKKVTDNPTTAAGIVGTIAATTFLCHRCRSIFSTRILFEAHYK